MSETRDKGKKPKPAGLHAGHRERMRQRFLTSGLDSFQDHEVLELLLYYAIPRRDVNELAHMLLRHFGTLAAVLDAPIGELCAIPGIGPNTAQFLNLIPQIKVQLERKLQSAEPVFLRTGKDVAAFLATQLPMPLEQGQVLLVAANKRGRVLATRCYGSFEEMTDQAVILQLIQAQANLCILIEAVADCTDLPLPRRLQALDQLAGKLGDLTMPLWDFFAVDDLGHRPRSYAKCGLLLPR